MSAPNEKDTYPPEFAADLHKLDCLKAARLLRDPANLAELNAPEFWELYAAVSDYRWNHPDFCESVEPDAGLGDDEAEKDFRDGEVRALRGER